MSHEVESQRQKDWEMFRRAVSYGRLPDHLTSDHMAHMTAILTGTQEEPRP